MNLTDATEEQLQTALELKDATRCRERAERDVREFINRTAPDLIRRLEMAIQHESTLRVKVAAAQ